MTNEHSAQRRAHVTKAKASVFLVLKASLRSFGANRNLETAATLAFYGFLSLMPLLLVAIIMLGWFLRSSDDVSSALADVLNGLFPAFNVTLLSDVQAITAGGALSALSIVLLMWSMTPLSGALRSALARMFKMPLQRSFLSSKFIDLGAVLSFLLLFVLLVGIQVLVPAASGGWFTSLFGALLPFVLSVVFLGLFFRVFAPVRLSWQQWLLGAVCVTLLWALMRYLFVIFMQYNPNYGYAFGSLKAIFLLIVWVYYSFAALLLGAEIMANTYRRDALLLRCLLHQEAGRSKNDALMKKFERSFNTGDVLFEENQQGTEMYVVLEGSVRLSRNGKTLLSMGEGKYFGEMSLLTRAPRSATATAERPTRLAVITQNNFDLLVRENPILVRGLLEELAIRLANTNRNISKPVS